MEVSVISRRICSYFYGYSCNLNGNVSNIPDGDLYNGMRNFLVHNNYYITTFVTGLSGTGYDYYAFLCSNNRDIGFVYNGTFSSFTRTIMYSLSSWEPVYISSEDFVLYEYSPYSKEFTINSNLDQTLES